MTWIAEVRPRERYRRTCDLKKCIKDSFADVNHRREYQVLVCQRNLKYLFDKFIKFILCGMSSKKLLTFVLILGKDYCIL